MVIHLIHHSPFWTVTGYLDTICTFSFLQSSTINRVNTFLLQFSVNFDTSLKMEKIFSDCSLFNPAFVKKIWIDRLDSLSLTSCWFWIAGTTSSWPDVTNVIPSPSDFGVHISNIPSDFGVTIGSWHDYRTLAWPSYFGVLATYNTHTHTCM